MVCAMQKAPLVRTLLDLPCAFAVKEEAGVQLKLASRAGQLKINIADCQCFPCLSTHHPRLMKRKQPMHQNHQSCYVQ